MEEQEFILNILSGMFGGLLVLEASFFTEKINPPGLKIFTTAFLVFVFSFFLIKIYLKKNGTY